MFKVNDYVIYNSMGVYKIIDIRKEKILMMKRLSIILCSQSME